MKGLELIVKTPLGLERIVASRIEELGVRCRVTAKPGGYPGIVAVDSVLDEEKVELAERIKREIPEAERVLVSQEVVEAEEDEIVEAALRISRRSLNRDASFAVRTVRRGSHRYRSVDINHRVGAAVVREVDAPVDLEYPDKILWVEIIDDLAALGVLDGREVWRKRSPKKRDVRRFFSKASIVQMPYLGPKDAARSMGSRIGRAVQMFEVGELVIAVAGAVDARQLGWFIQGVLEGVESRFRVQQRTYAHKPRRVEVRVQDLYQLVRDRRGEPKVVFEPEGEAFPSVAGRLADLFLSGEERINLFFGSREGIPKGIFRLADLIIDLCPGITLSTEYAASSALIGIAFALEEKIKDQE